MRAVRLGNLITCADCGAGITWDDALYDELTESYFCDRDCFVDWANHSQKPIAYYEYHNVERVDLAEAIT